MEHSIGEREKWSLEPEVIVFHRPFEQGAEATVKFTNFSNLPGTIQFTLIDGKGLASLGLLHQIFHLKGPNIVTDSRAVRSTTDSNTTATIVSGYPVYPVPVFFPFRSSCFTYLNVTMHPPDLALVRLKPITPAEERMGPLPQSFTICFWTGPVRGWTSAVQDWTTLGPTSPSNFTLLIRYMDRPELDLVPRPINTIDELDLDTPRSEPCECNQCQRSSGVRYKCTECEESPYHLCSECVSRHGREAHMARYGPSHRFEPISRAKECGVCSEEVEEKFYSCIPCNEANSEKAVMCPQCYSDHQNIIDHSEGKSFGHIFKKIDVSPPLCNDPEPCFYERSKPMICNGCKSMIRLEFFRCLDCVKPFNLCDRCADEGGVAKHSSHKFEFSIPTTVVPKPGESSSANRLPNPEA